MQVFKVTKWMDEYPAASLNLYLLPNDDPAHDGRPFALIENVRTESGFENQGHATDVLRAAIERARAEGCYKVMLATSSNRPKVRHLYEKLGFDPCCKTACHLPL